MLTRDLLRARVKGRTIAPTYVDATRRDLIEPAEEMVAAAEAVAARGGTLGELKDALDDAVGPHRSAKVLKGCAKLLLDRCDVDVDAPIPPVELRAKVFRASRAHGPLALGAGALDRPTASDVLAEVAADLGTTPEVVSASLYADLKEAQVVTRYRPLGAEALLQRYNVALVQGLLVRATEVKVTLEGPSVARIRQLLRHAKFRQLLFRAERDGTTLTLTLDGPASVLRQSTRYGLALALFFPAVLLQEVPWRLEATVLWTKARHRKQLEVGSEQGLVSHMADTGAYDTRERQWFKERWADKADDLPWTMSEDVTPVELGGRGVVLPDFTFTDGTRTAHLEIVGVWRKDWLKRHLEGLRRHGPGNLVLAVSRKLAADADELDDAAVEVVSFAQVVPVGKVVEALEAVAR